MLEVVKEKIRENNRLYNLLAPVYDWTFTRVEKIKFFFSPKGYMVNYICYPIGGIVRSILAFLIPGYLREIKELKNRHRGERCFIIGTGPSLRLEDLEKLSELGEISFASNSIYKLFDKTDWRPDYYCCLDLELVEKLNREYEARFFEDVCKRNFFVDSRIKTLPYSSKKIKVYINRLLHGFGIKDDDLRYSYDLVKGIYDEYDVTITAIQIAQFMGFGEVYLLGVDCSYMQKEKYAIGAENVIENWYSEDYYSYMEWQKQKAFTYIKNMIEDKYKDFHVYNATRGGKLDCFERSNIDELLSKSGKQRIY